MPASKNASPPSSPSDATGSPISGYDHVDLRFRNRAAAREFFERGLGLELMGDAPDHTFLLFGDVVLGLHDTVDDASGHGTIDHLALRVDRFDGLREWLHLRGITPVREKRRTDSQSLFLEGPEGLQVELIHRLDPSQHGCESAPHRRPGLDRSTAQA